MYRSALSKCMGSLINMTERGTFASWLYRVSVNHCMDTFRKKKVETVEYSDETGGGSLTPEVVYLQKEKYRQLENLLATLKKEGSPHCPSEIYERLDL
ncbi:RNA polymerase sigma factor [Bacillus sp. m3-13]|uniref:RNA polymerase sigma factor n=1 Tax=Bacillus sp. m3-13 TaxID=406124 RepID=UPI001F1BCC47|nr:hypothetical protein [Bacillus sp. m3-13]